MTDAELLESAAHARKVELSSGDRTFAGRLHFAWLMGQLDGGVETIDITTTELRKAAPLTCSMLNCALQLGIRGYVA